LAISQFPTAIRNNDTAATSGQRVCSRPFTGSAPSPATVSSAFSTGSVTKKNRPRSALSPPGLPWQGQAQNRTFCMRRGADQARSLPTLNRSAPCSPTTPRRGHLVARVVSRQRLHKSHANDPVPQRAGRIAMAMLVTGGTRCSWRSLRESARSQRTCGPGPVVQVSADGLVPASRRPEFRSLRSPMATSAASARVRSPSSRPGQCAPLGLAVNRAPRAAGRQRSFPARAVRVPAAPALP
jgi:hypothetical protein